MALPDLGRLALCSTSAPEDEWRGEQAITPDPTGVLGPVGPVLQAMVAQKVAQWVANPVQPHAQPVVKLGPLPHFLGDEVYQPTNADVIYRNSIPVSGVMVNGVSYDGRYTGTVLKQGNVPESNGELIVEMIAPHLSPFALFPDKRENIVAESTEYWKVWRSIEPPEKLKISGYWHNGQLVDGEVTVQDKFQGIEMKVSTLIEDDRPFGGTHHQVSLLQEARVLVDQTVKQIELKTIGLMQKIYVEHTEKVVSWLGYVTLNLSGQIRWTPRPSAHKFAWANEFEDVRMRDGKGTLTVDYDHGQWTNNPVLSGQAEVTLAYESDTGVRHIRLWGNMVDNYLQGVVLAAEPIPGLSFVDNDYRFFIDGYDWGGAPIVRLLTDDEKKTNPSTWVFSYPKFHGEHMNEAIWNGWKESWFQEFMTTWLTRLFLVSFGVVALYKITEIARRSRERMLTVYENAVENVKKCIQQGGDVSDAVKKASNVYKKLEKEYPDGLKSDERVLRATSILDDEVRRWASVPKVTVAPTTVPKATTQSSLVAFFKK